MDTETDDVPKALARRNRRLKVAELLERGLTTRQIAAEVGVSHATVAEDAKVVVQALSEQQERDLETARTLEAERLDKLQEAVWGRALEGDSTAIESALLIMARRAALLGLDMTGGEVVGKEL
jgi:orotate phosphoribosyltransferase-like protein